MLKKKNIAMVMAATTVATSVAPIFASTIDVQKVDEANMIAKVEELLNTRYTNASETGDASEGTIQANEEYKNSVYKIMAGTVRIENISILKNEIEKAKVAGNDLTLEVTDKGHKEVNGQIVATELTKNSYYTNLSNLGNELDESKLTAVGASSVRNTTTSATITLANGNEIDLLVGDYVLDLDKPVDANGNEIDPAKATTLQTQRKIVGFKLLEGTEEIKNIASKRVLDLKITSKIEITEDLADLYTKSQGYSEKGEKLVNLITQEAVKSSNAGRVVKDGVEYQIETFVETNLNELSEVEVTKDGYELTINLEVRKMNVAFDTTPGSKNVSMVIKSTSQADLVKLRNDIYNKIKVTAGKFDVLAGDDRFETAIAVSQEQYADKNEDTSVSQQPKAQAIVLVGEEAIVDGLAAAPLAKQNNAPILLTKKDAVPTETMNEIKRLVGKGSKIYLVGGEHNISKEVEAQLISEMNANIVRLAGDDRYETSLEIANELNVSGASKTAFVVGGDGLADAMSIAAVAAKDGVPVIVTPADGLTKDAKAYLKETTAITDVDVVGGEAKVSTDVLKDVKAITGRAQLTVERVAGDTRNETNAKVVNKYFTNSLSNVYVAKDGDNSLVDALAAAPFVATKNGAIVLATNDITKEQSDAVKNNMTGMKSLTQVGNGVATTVIEKLVKLLNL